MPESDTMYCIKCGSENSDEAQFCRKCGNEIDPEVETKVAGRPVEDADGSVIFSIGPTLKFIKIGYALAAIGALLLVALLSVFGVTVLIAIPLGLMLFLVPAFYHVKAKLVRYSLRDTQIEVDEGLISRTTRNIPLRRIQDVTVTTSFLQRILGFGDLVIDNASEDGGKVALKNIDSPQEYAETLLKHMRRLDS